MAGGVTERGAQSRTKIQRMVDGKLVEIKAKMTDLVLPNEPSWCRRGFSSISATPGTTMARR